MVLCRRVDPGTGREREREREREGEREGERMRKIEREGGVGGGRR